MLDFGLRPLPLRVRRPGQDVSRFYLFPPLPHHIALHYYCGPPLCGFFFLFNLISAFLSSDETRRETKVFGRSLAAFQLLLQTSPCCCWAAPLPQANNLTSTTPTHPPRPSSHPRPHPHPDPRLFVLDRLPIPIPTPTTTTFTTAIPFSSAPATWLSVSRQSREYLTAVTRIIYYRPARYRRRATTTLFFNSRLQYITTYPFHHNHPPAFSQPS